jgi:hypothetical protein
MATIEIRDETADAAGTETCRGKGQGRHSVRQRHLSLTQEHSAVSPFNLINNEADVGFTARNNKRCEM